MKKGLALALALCMALLMSVTAFADGRGPAFTRYEVVCQKDTPYYRENWEKDGAWEKKGSFPSGTTLTVDYEYEKDGVLYGDVQIGNEYDENVEWVYIRLSDVELKNDTYLPENAQKLSRARSVRVIGKGGIPLYAGPNTKYDKIMTIPRGTKLTYNYGNDEEDYYRTWAYVTYLGKSGWIYVYASDTKNGLAELPDEGANAQIWVLADDVKMFDGFSFGNMEDELSDNYGVEVIRENHEEPDRVVGTLEKGKKYAYRYSHTQEFGTWYYITAGLRAGWVFMSNENSRIAASTTAADRDRFMAYKSYKLKLRETPTENANGTAVRIEKNTVLHPDFVTQKNYEEFFYETIQGQSGWYSWEDAGKACAYKVTTSYGGYNDRNESDQAAPIYSDIVTEGKTVGRIPAGSLFTPLYYGDYETQTDEENSEWVFFYYVRYNDVTGWVKERDLWKSDEEETTTEPEEEYEELDEDETWYEDEEWDEDEQEEDDEVEETIDFTPDYVLQQRSLSPLQIVLLCVGGAAILALTAVVTLLLIRRKRKNNAATPAAIEPDDEPAIRTEPEDEPETEAEPADEADES